MAEKQEVTCIKTGAWDSSTSRYYHKNDTDFIDPLSPIAMYFEGWKPGTEVYTKSRGDKNTDPVEGTRIVSGTTPEEEAAVKVEKDEKELARLTQEKKDREAQGFDESPETDQSEIELAKLAAEKEKREKMFHCKECDWETEHESALARHMTMEHPEVEQPDD